MLPILRRPYRSDRTAGMHWRSALIFGAFVFLFLAVFRPFGLTGWRGNVWLLALGYGATTTLVMLLLNVVVPVLMPQWFDEERWTVGREIGWVLVNLASIGAANLMYSHLAGIGGLGWWDLLRFEGYTLLVGIFPVSLGVLWNEYRLARRYQNSSAAMNTGIGTHQHQAASPVRVVIPSETAQEDLELGLDELLFLRSDGNYVEVHHLEQGRPVRTVLRCSLKRAEEALAAHPSLLRCHKRHLVNLDRVRHVSGNAQGYHLFLEAEVDPVPVSRSLNDQLPELLAARP